MGQADGPAAVGDGLPDLDEDGGVNLDIIC